MADKAKADKARGKPASKERKPAKPVAKVVPAQKVPAVRRNLVAAPKAPPSGGPSASELAQYQASLETLRDHLRSEIDGMETKQVCEPDRQEPGDLVDMSTASFSHEFIMGMLSSESELLVEVEAALERIQAGTYGFCEVTGEPIPAPRLQALPWTRYSVKVQQDIERGRRS